MATIAELVVRATMDNRGLTQGFSAAQRRATEFSNHLNSTLGSALTFTAIAGGLTALFKAADALDASERQLAATSRITGQNLGFLQSVAAGTNANFRTGARTANAFAIELTKLTSKAGQINQTSAAVGALLDLGAARSLGTEGSLKAIQQAILGIDEGTDKLFGKNPIVIYQEFAKSIGTTAGKLTDAQKAQAILNELMVTGGKVAGEYGEFLKSPRGQQELLRLKTEDAAAAIGRSLNAMRAVAIPVFAAIVDGVRKFIGGVQIMAAELPAANAKVGLWAAQFGAFVLRGVAAAIRAISGFSSYLARIPEPIRRLMGLGDVGADAQRGFDVASGLEARATSMVAGARRSLQFAREAAEDIAAEIVTMMENAMAISGPTNPIDVIAPPGAAEQAGKVAGALRDQADAVRAVVDAYNLFGGRQEVLDAALRLNKGIEDSLGRQNSLLTEASIELARQRRDLMDIVALANRIPDRPIGNQGEAFNRVLRSLTPNPQAGSLFGGELAPEMTRTQQALAAIAEVGFQAAEGMRSFGRTVGEFGKSQLNNAISGLAGLAAQLTPAGIAAEFFARVVDALRPVIEALLVPITIVAQVFAAGIVPVLKLLFPIIKIVAIAFTYLQEAALRVTAAVVGGFGFLLRGLGKFLNAITPFANPGNPLVRAGEAMQRTASGFLDAAREAARARDELRDLSWEDALGRGTEAMNRLTESVVNAVEGFKANRLRFNATDASQVSSILPPTSPVTSTGGGSVTQVSGISMPVTIITSGDPDETYRGLYRKMEFLALANPSFRSIFALYPAPT